jgi:hypothetical protein
MGIYIFLVKNCARDPSEEGSIRGDKTAKRIGMKLKERSNCFASNGTSGKSGKSYGCWEFFLGKA